MIITTAYQEFALESYELNVCDYLLKPFSLERFLKAVNRAQALKNMQEEAAASKTTLPPTTVATPTPSGDAHLFVKGDKKLHRINLEDILYLESAGSYVKLHMAHEMVMTLERLAHFEATLPADTFVRVHKSFIIATKKIEVIEGNTIIIHQQRIPIGKVYKHNLERIIGL